MIDTRDVQVDDIVIDQGPQNDHNTVLLQHMTDCEDIVDNQKKGKRPRRKKANYKQADKQAEEELSHTLVYQYQPSVQAKHDKMATSLDDCPTDNDFQNFVDIDPVSTDHKYSLPPYMALFVQNLLEEMNEYPPPSNLAFKLHPFIVFDKTANAYKLVENDLNLLTLQRLDFLVSKDKPNIFRKAISNIRKKRPQSS